jgi:hypothetical protein
MATSPLTVKEHANTSRLSVKVQWKEQERTFGPFPLEDLRLETLRTKVEETFRDNQQRPEAEAGGAAADKDKEGFFEFTDGDTLVHSDDVLRGLAVQLLRQSTKPNQLGSQSPCPCLLLFVYRTRKRERGK